VCGRHPMLRCRIIEKEDGSFFFSENAVEVFPVLREAAKDASSFFEELLQEPFQSGYPLWEIALTRISHSSHIFLKIHHALADGTAARSLLCEILRIAGGEPPGPSLGLRPSVEELVAGGRQTFAEPLPVPANSLPWKFAATASIKERLCRVCLMELDCEALRVRAHRDQLTINSLLMAALAKAAAELPGFPSEAALILPVSVRHRIEPAVPDEEMGCLIGNALVYWEDGSSSDIGKVASALGEQLWQALGAAITGPEKFEPSTVEAAIAPFRDPAQSSFGYPLALSNLGKGDNPPSCVEALWFGASVCPGHLGVLTAASTVGDKLCLAFHYAEPLVEGESVGMFAESVRRLLIPIS